MAKCVADMGLGQMSLEEDGRPQMGLIGLDNDVLSRIISFLDYRAFHNICLTCKGLNEIAQDRYCWNSSVLFRRIRHLILKACFEEGWFAREKGCYPKRKHSSLMKDCLELGQTLAAINIGVAKLIWKENGPVIFKLYSQLYRYVFSEMHSSQGSLWQIRRKTITFKLPIGDLMIQVSIIESEKSYQDDLDNDDDYEDEEGGHFQRERELEDKFPHGKIKVKGYLNDKCIVIYQTSKYEEPHTITNPDTEDCPISTNPDSMQPIIHAIMKSLPSFNTKFSIEFLMELLLKLPFRPIEDSQSFRFSDEELNIQPRWVDFYEQLSQVRKENIDLYNNKIKQITIIKEENKDDFDELILYLSVLLQKNDNSFYKYVNQCYHASAKVQLDLLLTNENIHFRSLLPRIDFLKSTCIFTAPGEYECKIRMEIPGGDVLFIESSYKREELEPNMVISFKFTLNETNLMDTEWICDPGWHKIRNDLGHLKPITEVLQRCVDADIKSHPEKLLVTNKIAAQFFQSLIRGIANGTTGLF